MGLPLHTSPYLWYWIVIVNWLLAWGVHSLGSAGSQALLGARLQLTVARVIYHFNTHLPPIRLLMKYLRVDFFHLLRFVNLHAKLLFHRKVTVLLTKICVNKKVNRFYYVNLCKNKFHYSCFQNFWLEWMLSPLLTQNLVRKNVFILLGPSTRNVRLECRVNADVI